MNTTHIGSLPYKTIEEAINFNKGLTLPCLPTLPLLDDKEWMISQFTSGFMQDDHKLHFCCFNNFFEEFRGRVKIQVCGIQTLFNNRPIDVRKDDFIRWYKLVVKRFVDSIPNEFVLFFDEPYLRDLDFELWNVYQDFSSYDLGVHSCAKVVWQDFDWSSFNHVSFDSSRINKIDLDFLRSLTVVLYIGDISTVSGELNGSFLENSEYLTPSCGLALSELKIVAEIKTVLSR